MCCAFLAFLKVIVLVCDGFDFSCLVWTLQSLFQSELQAHRSWACVFYGSGLCSDVAELSFAGYI